MATTNITQVKRVVISQKSSAEAAWDSIIINEAELGQDTVATVNVAPRLAEKSTQLGTTSSPIPGTYNELSGSITFQADTFEIIGRALRKFNPATYEDATANNGNIVFGGANNMCDSGPYQRVIVQGLCDDGSTADIEFARCLPSIDDDIEVGSETSEVTLNLHPQIYNSTTMASDGYSAYDVRFGDNSLSKKQRLNVTTGAYEAVKGES